MVCFVINVCSIKLVFIVFYFCFILYIVYVFIMDYVLIDIYVINYWYIYLMLKFSLDFLGFFFKMIYF